MHSNANTHHVTPPEAEHKRHRLFDFVVLPLLAVVTLLLVALAVTR